MNYLLFDYNGTILNDVDLSLEGLNMVVDKYLDRGQVSLQEYLEVFDFPVRDYYENVGFDFSIKSFEEIGLEWSVFYRDNFRKKTFINPGIMEFIAKAKKKDYRCVILSAAFREQLEEELKYLGIYDLFDEVIGADDIYGKTKTENGVSFIERHPDDECLLIGDTIHDFHTAEAMGINCVLVAKGHQSKSRLLSLGVPVYDDIREISL